MRLAMVAAKFTDVEANGLRRAMATFRNVGTIGNYETMMVERMVERGYDRAFAQRCFEQIKGFGSYGFPQSHAASFAKLVLISCWLKRHEPAAFVCGLLNAQPMGFYKPSQIVQDAKRSRGQRQGVEFLPVDVMHSDWDNQLVGGVPRTSGGSIGVQPAIRLGLRQIGGLSEQVAGAISRARAHSGFRDVADLCLRAGLDEKARNALAEAGALQGLVGNRNNARWIMAGVERQRPLFPGSPEESVIDLPAPTTGEDVLSDYRALGLTLGAHPMSLLRERMRARRLLGSRELQDKRHGSHVHAVGLVTNRQRPASAHGTMFVTLEDEHGMVNVVVWEHVAQRRRKALLGATLLAVRGRWEQVDGVAHLIAQDMQDLSDLLGTLRTTSRNFH